MTYDKGTEGPAAIRTAAGPRPRLRSRGGAGGGWTRRSRRASAHRGRGGGGGFRLVSGTTARLPGEVTSE